MTHPVGLLTRAADRAVLLYLWLVHGLEALLPLFDLSVRLYLANIFWKGGMVKLSSWMSTVMLFTMVYDVPVLPPEIAAYLSTAVELGGSFLLAIGLAGRWAALSLFGLNIVAVLSYGQLSEAALQEAFYWGILFLYFVLHGPGLISMDALLERFYRRRHAISIANEAATNSPSLTGRDVEMPALTTFRLSDLCFITAKEVRLIDAKTVTEPGDT